uniref:Rx N-terminal domain-containing protein n=1 Tax=Fagus sylvatica TaxID=28930 RepID=A0A2N9IEK1_FAGSY
MAESLASDLLKQLGSIAARQAEQEIRLVVGADKEVRKLQGNLRTIQAVLDDAEKKQLKENAVKLWLEKLKDTFYEMDDVLDEWNTAFIKSEIEKEEEKAENAPILKKKVRSFITSSSCCLRQVKKLGLRHDIARKIKELRGKIDELFKERVGYGFDLSRGTQVVERLTTTSLVDVSTILGRDKDRNDLVRNILGEGSVGERNPFVISLVGMGDDVWTEKTTDWDPFKLALNCGAQGSRILVTTRNDGVARMDEKQCEQLEGLGSRKLANKCKGLPLAAMTLGSLM